MCLDLILALYNCFPNTVVLQSDLHKHGGEYQTQVLAIFQ
jgi:hypothetical protein